MKYISDILKLLNFKNPIVAIVLLVVSLFVSYISYQNKILFSNPILIIFLTVTFVISLSNILQMLFNVFGNFLKKFKTHLSLDTSNFSDEEKAILSFYINNRFSPHSFNKNAPAILNLKDKGFINYRGSFFMVIDGYSENFECFFLTDAGSSKLKSTSFQKKILSNLNSEKALDYINTITNDPVEYYNSLDLS